MNRILLFTRLMGSGGTETVIVQLAEAYRDLGCYVCVCGAPGPSVEKIKALGLKFYPIADMQSKDPRTVAGILSAVSRIIDEEKINIVHTHHRMAAFYAWLLRMRHRFVFLNNIHNTFTDKRTLTRIAYTKAVNIAVGSAVAENMLRDYGLPEKSIRVIYNAVKQPAPRTVDDPMLKQLREDGKFIVTNIGRLDTQKGMEFYIRAASAVKRSNAQIAFLIVGEGPLHQELAQLVKLEGLEDVVWFLGYRTDVSDIIDQSDLMVLSSLWEGFPLIPIECFSVGRTIVATNVPGTMEIVKDGENGLIVPTENPEAIAAAVLKLYGDREELDRLARNAKQTYLEKFSYESFRDQYLCLLREVTKGEKI